MVMAEQVNADICLSASAFHQETWQPAWTVRTLVSALRAHMATKVRNNVYLETRDQV
jgi:ubiquitin-conjugating enzyme E2 J1